MGFQGLSNGAQAKQGEIKDLYCGLRHAELSRNQATVSFCDFAPKRLNCLLVRFSLSPQAPARQGGNT